MLRKSAVTSSAILAIIVFTSARIIADEKPDTVTYSIGIKGLTCETCSASAEKELAKVTGVVKSAVDWKAGHAWVTVQISQREHIRTATARRISTELATAVTRAGVHHGDGFTPTVNYLLTITGMTCEDCSQHVATALKKVPGVKTANVNYKSAYAIVVPSAKSAPNPNSLVLAVEKAGYNASVSTGPFVAE